MAAPLCQIQGAVENRASIPRLKRPGRRGDQRSSQQGARVIRGLEREPGRRPPRRPRRNCTGRVELPVDREHDAASGAAVELREHDPGGPDRFDELAGLRQPVATRRRVEDEQHLMGRAREPPVRRSGASSPAPPSGSSSCGGGRPCPQAAAGLRAPLPRRARRREPPKGRLLPVAHDGKVEPVLPRSASCSMAPARNVSAAASRTSDRSRPRGARAWRLSSSCPSR